MTSYGFHEKNVPFLIEKKTVYRKAICGLLLIKYT